MKTKAQQRKTVLIAGIGTSPAVLTETVWALAHQKKPVVPDEVVVITTTAGRRKLKDEILKGHPGVWEQLKDALRKEKIKVDGKLAFGDTSIRVIPDANKNEADDLRTGDDNLRAADFMLDELRKHTESSDTEVLCSIAGGRKTMSALLFSCMTLLGREQDKVYHVLIPPEYECGMEPPFYFPRKGETHRLLSRGRLTDKKVLSTKIVIELFDVPFVRMRGWYSEKFKSSLPTYRTLISRVQTIAPPARVYPKIEINAWKGVAWIDGTELHFGAYEFAALIMLANGISNLDAMFKRFVKLANGVEEIDVPIWLGSLEKERGKFSAYDESNWRDQNQEVSKILARLRGKLAEVNSDVANSLVPKRNQAVSFPLSGIKWVADDEDKKHKELRNICGYLFSGDKM